MYVRFNYFSLYEGGVRLLVYLGVDGVSYVFVSKVAENDTWAPSGSVVFCVMSAGITRLGPGFVHCSKNSGVDYAIRFPDASYAATVLSPATCPFVELPNPLFKHSPPVRPN